MSEAVSTDAKETEQLPWVPLQRPEWAEGFVYLLETSERWQKIGYSADPRARADGFQQLPFCVWLSHFFPVGSARLEKVVHRALRAKRVRGEWFVLSPGEIEAFKSVKAARYSADLPDALRPTATNPTVLESRQEQRQCRRHRRSGGRVAKAWFRTSRNRWYIWHEGVQMPLAVTGAENEEAARAAGEELLALMSGVSAAKPA
jgi:hypothetical protein